MLCVSILHFLLVLMLCSSHGCSQYVDLSSRVSLSPLQSRGLVIESSNPALQLFALNKHRQWEDQRQRLAVETPEPSHLESCSLFTTVEHGTSNISAVCKLGQPHVALVINSSLEVDSTEIRHAMNSTGMTTRIALTRMHHHHMPLACCEIAPVTGCTEIKTCQAIQTPA